MTSICAHEEDMSAVVELDVVLPHVCQKLRSLFGSIFDTVILLVLMIIRVEVGDMPGKVDIDNSKSSLSCTMNVGLYHISL